MTRHYPDLGSASDWSCRVGNLIQPIRSTAQLWEGCVISMEFLRSFLRLHLAGKPVVASPNVDCFLLFWRTNFKSGIRSCSQFKKDTLMSPKCVMRSVDLFAGTRALSVRVAAHSRPRNQRHIEYCLCWKTRSTFRVFMSRFDHLKQILRLKF